MAQETELRPRAISQAVADDLAELLSFRHYLIHGSLVVSPDGERLSYLREATLRVREQLTQDLDLFDGHIAMLIDAASE